MDSGTKQEVTILIAEDDDGHAELIKDNLHESGLRNPLIRFATPGGAGFLLRAAGRNHAPPRAWQGLHAAARHPHAKVDGVTVLKRIKEATELKNMPVIMLTTTDDPREIRKCYDLGCNCYVTKPLTMGSLPIY